MGVFPIKDIVDSRKQLLKTIIVFYFRYLKKSLFKMSINIRIIGLLEKLIWFLLARKNIKPTFVLTFKNSGKHV
jgi:hypothetical protein